MDNHTTEEWWTKVQNKRRGEKRAAGEEKDTPTPSKSALPAEKRKLAFDTDGSLTRLEAGERDRRAKRVMSAVHRAMWQAEVPGFIRLASLYINGRGTLAGDTTKTCTAETFLRYKEVAIWAARTECACITDISTNETWTRVNVHGIPWSPTRRRGPTALEGSGKS